MRQKRKSIWISLFLIAVLLLSTSCGGAGAASAGTGSGGTETAEATGSGNGKSDKAEGEDSEEASAEEVRRYEAPKFETSKFRKKKAEGYEGAWIDTSSVSKGYVAVSAESDTRLKFQVLKEDITYNYDVASDGTPSIFPLQSGNGTYTFRIMENIVDTKYAEVFSTTCKVKLKNKFQPCIRPSDYVNYSKNSECVKIAAELAAEQEDALGVVSAIYEYVCKSVKYDKKKAETVKSGYLPTPDETLSTGKGICFDYASLTASMLRSQGIPTKVIFGYVAPHDLYHAWNMFYTKETGWVVVSFEVKEDSWNRIDLTFAANGADDDFIGDGSNYSDLYSY